MRFMLISEPGSELEPRALGSSTPPHPETLAGPQLCTRLTAPESPLPSEGGRWQHCRAEGVEEPLCGEMSHLGARLGFPHKHTMRTMAAMIV